MDKQLLILDLDETLIHGALERLDRDSEFCVASFFVYKRPFLDEFLHTVLEWFDVAVWSSASPLYVQAVVQQVFPESASLRFVWANDRCVRRLDLEQFEYYWVKDLKKVKRLGFPLERVLMIDDSPRKLQRHYGNVLRVRPFLGDAADAELRHVLPFLDSLRGVENVRVVEKRHWRAFGGQ